MESMNAIRVHAFGGPESLRLERVPTPSPGSGEVLVRVFAAGVGPWDAWVRSGRSVINQPLPLTPGSDLAGIVAAVGPGVSEVQIGDPVFGVTNAQFTGAYAEYTVATASMLARQPDGLAATDAASLPVVACTAWQMVFDHGLTDGTKRVLVHGAAGNVGAYAVQLARRAAREVIATARPADLEYSPLAGSPPGHRRDDVPLRGSGDGCRYSARHRRRRDARAIVWRACAGRGSRVVGCDTRPDHSGAASRSRGVLPRGRVVAAAGEACRSGGRRRARHRRWNRAAPLRGETRTRDAGRHTTQARKDSPDVVSGAAAARMTPGA